MRVGAQDVGVAPHLRTYDPVVVRQKRVSPAIVCHDREMSTAETQRKGLVTIGSPTRLTLHRRLFLAYASVLLLALLALVLAPVTVSVPVRAGEVVVLVGGLVAMLALFRVLLRRALDPLERLTMLMERVDPLTPGQRLDVDARDGEVAALTEAFNGMLDRLEGERRESARRALAAQEGERRRIARELHDEIGQVLTGLVLRSETLSRRAPDDLRGDLEELREAARHGAEEVRTIARRLRPEALDELGLQSALLALCSAVSERAGCGSIATWSATCRSTQSRSWSSTGSRRRASPTWCVTRATTLHLRCDETTRAACCSSSETTASACPLTPRSSQTVCAGCASARCSSGPSSRSGRLGPMARRSPSGAR